MDLSDRVSLDLRRLAKQEREAELDYLEDLPNRRWQAMQDIQDPNALRKLLQDEVLAGPLARAMYNLEFAQKEISELREEPVGIRACLQSLSQIELMLFNMAMGEE